MKFTPEKKEIIAVREPWKGRIYSVQLSLKAYSLGLSVFVYRNR